MLCDMHERGSLNYRHHAKSYFITVVVWAYSFHPSVSIKCDERRRRRRRRQQDRSLATRIHLTALRFVDNYYLLWSIWLVLKIYTNNSGADNQLAVIYAKRTDSMQILNDFTLATEFRYHFVNVNIASPPRTFSTSINVEKRNHKSNSNLKCIGIYSNWSFFLVWNGKCIFHTLRSLIGILLFSGGMGKSWH